MSRTPSRRRSRPARPRARPAVEALEQRLNPSPLPPNLDVFLIPEIDQFGDQIITTQAYASPGQAIDQVNRVTFAIFDTGASAMTFGAEDLANMPEAIPVKVLGGAVAEGIGGVITGDVSEPGDIIADGLGASELTFDEYGFPLFDILYTAGSGRTPNLQAFLGTEDGSPILPSITGTPLLNVSPPGNPINPNGLAAYVEMLGYQMDFTGLFGDPSDPEPFYIAMPGIQFVDPTAFTHTVPADLAYDPAVIPLGLTGFNNYADPGDLITETPSPIIPNTTLVRENIATVTGQNFLFDTGAQLSIISSQQATALGFDLSNPGEAPYRIEVQGAAGTREVVGYLLDQLVIERADLNPDTGRPNTITFHDVPVFVLDVGYDIDGIFGMNLLNMAHSFLYNPHAPGGPTLSLSYLTSRDTEGLEDLLAGGGLEGGLVQNIVAGQGYDPAQFQSLVDGDPFLQQFLADMGAGSLGGAATVDDLFSSPEFTELMSTLEQLLRDLDLLAPGETFDVNSFLEALGAPAGADLQALGAYLDTGLGAGLGKSFNLASAGPYAAFNTLAGSRLPIYVPVISGRVARDDGDGILEATDPGQAGRTVFLDLDHDGLPGDSEPWVATGPDGSYGFVGADPGTYTVRLVPAESEQLLLGPDPISLTAGQPVTGADFLVAEGVPPPATVTIAGRVLLDADGDLATTGDRTGVPGRTVFLDANGNGSPDGGESSITTSADGSYQFTSLPAGSYTVRLVPSGSEQLLLFPEQPITPTPGVPFTGADFMTAAEIPPPATATISGAVLLDADGDLATTGDRTGVPGRTVFLDANGNGSPDGGEASVITGAGGAYEFANRQPGQAYAVRLVPAGGEQLLLSPGPITPAPGQTVSNADFLTRTITVPPPGETATLGGRLLYDADGNRAVSPGDQALAGRRVFLDANGDGLWEASEASVLTAADGSYSFTNLPAGAYHVQAALPPGLSLAAAPGPVALAAGAAVTAADFLVVRVDPQTQFVQEVYVTVLGRAPDAAGLAYWSGMLTGGRLDRAGLVRAFRNSQEFRGLMVRNEFLTLLGREPDEGGLAHYTGVLAAGGTLELVRAQIMASDEFLGRGLSDADFLARLYRAALGREIDPVGLSDHGQALAAGTPRAAVAAGVADSPEGRRSWVAQLYQRVLHRAPDEGGLAYWADARLGSGTPRQTIWEEFTGSREFLSF